jgi:hypothetical protein
LDISTEHRKWLQNGFVIFLEINIWHFEKTKSLQIGFIIFLEPSLNWPIMSTVWFINFLAKTEWALKKKITTVWFINFFGHYKMVSPNPSKKAKKKTYIILVPFLGVNPLHFAEEIPRGINMV